MQVGVPALKKTVNPALTAEGLVYPTFYRKLYPDLRKELARVAKKARPESGLWTKDRDDSGLTVKDVDQVEADGVIMTKLFRRLVDYLALGDGDSSLAGFSAYLKQREDRLFILSSATGRAFTTWSRSRARR